MLVKAYHGTTRSFKDFDLSHLGGATKSRSARFGFWFTDDVETAKSYAREENNMKVNELLRNDKRKEALELEEQIWANTGTKYLKEVSLSYKNPLIIDADERQYNDYSEEIIDATKKAIDNKNDVLIVKNLSDHADYSEHRPATHYLVLDNSIIKQKGSDIKYEEGANIENKTKTKNMDNTIEISTSEYKFAEFYDWFKNYIPASLYAESWVSELKALNTLIVDNNVQDKITFTDDRLVLTAVMALNYSDVTRAGLREWWLVRRYLQQFASNTSVQGTDLLEFVDMHIGYTFTDATLKEKSLERTETLKKVLAEYVKNDSIMIPYFVKSEIMSGISEEVKEEIIEETSTEDETEEVAGELSVEQKWQGLKDFAELMMEDEEGEVLEKWKGLYDFCELMLEK